MATPKTFQNKKVSFVVQVETHVEKCGIHSMTTIFLKCTQVSFPLIISTSRVTTWVHVMWEMVFKSTSGIREGLLAAMNFILKFLTSHASKEQFERNSGVTKWSQIPETAITWTSKMHTLSDTTSFHLLFLQTRFKKKIMTFVINGGKSNKEKKATMITTMNTSSGTYLRYSILKPMISCM